MKAFGAILFAALAAVAVAGPALIPDHPICVPINNDYYHSFPDADDCHCFYKCDWANAVRFCCPADNESPGLLVFNPVLQVCDRKGAAEAAGAVCTAGPEPTVAPPTEPPHCHPTDPPTKPTDPPITPTDPPIPPTDPPTPTDPPASGDGCAYLVHTCPAQNEYYHSFPHETCDNKWCQCDWGKAIIQPCARDHAPKNYLVFDAELQVCDYQKAGVEYNLCE